MSNMKGNHGTDLQSLDQDQSTAHTKARRKAEVCPYSTSAEHHEWLEAGRGAQGLRARELHCYQGCYLQAPMRGPAPLPRHTQAQSV